MVTQTSVLEKIHEDLELLKQASMTCEIVWDERAKDFLRKIHRPDGQRIREK